MRLEQSRSWSASRPKQDRNLEVYEKVGYSAEKTDINESGNVPFALPTPSSDTQWTDLGSRVRQSLQFRRDSVEESTKAPTTNPMQSDPATVNNVRINI